MENVLKMLEFPYVHKMPPTHLIDLFDTNRDKLKQELSYMLKLRLPDNVKHQDVQAHLRFIGWKPIPLIVQMLLKGLIVRFNFHFNGKQKTNDPRKVNNHFGLNYRYDLSIFSPNGILIK